jgi:hypothetical protein
MILKPGQPGKLGGIAMSIELRGRSYLSLREDHWIACLKIAREFGCVLEMKEVKEDAMYGNFEIPDDDARSFGVALYKSIRAIEVDALTDATAELVKQIGTVGNLRAVADLAYVGGFLID